MNNWSGFGVLTLIVGALTGLVWYANRSGRNTAQLTASRDDVSLAQQTTQVVQDMAQSEAHKPTTKDAIIDRLEKGNA